MNRESTDLWTERSPGSLSYGRFRREMGYEEDGSTKRDLQYLVLVLVLEECRSRNTMTYLAVGRKKNAEQSNNILLRRRSLVYTHGPIHLSSLSDLPKD